MTGDRLTAPQAAALAGIATSTFRAYVSRGQNGAPKPAGHLDGRTPLWDRAEVESWIAGRIAHAEHSCGAQTDDLRWECTLPVRHTGEHVASDGARVMATWA